MSKIEKKNVCHVASDADEMNNALTPYNLDII